MRSIIVLFYMDFDFPSRSDSHSSPAKGDFYNCTVVEVRKSVMSNLSNLI